MEKDKTIKIKKCSVCFSELQNEELHCGNCGQPLEWEDNSQNRKIYK